MRGRAERRLRVIFLMYADTLRKGAKMMDLGSFQWCLVTGAGAMGINKRFPFEQQETFFFTMRVTEQVN